MALCNILHAADTPSIPATCTHVLLYLLTMKLHRVSWRPFIAIIIIMLKAGIAVCCVWMVAYGCLTSTQFPPS